MMTDLNDAQRAYYIIKRPKNGAINMSEMPDHDIKAAMALLDEKLKNGQPKRRGRKALLAPYADQLRKYVAAGWTRREIVAEMKALGLSISTATLRDVLGSQAAGSKAGRATLSR